jgi:trehalose 6-phosphate synthase
MRQTLRLAVAWMIGSMVLAGAGFFAISSMTRRWFESDMQLRTRLAVASARSGIVRAWRDHDDQELHTILNQITEDERIIGATLCVRTESIDPTRASTPGFPRAIACRELVAKLATLTPDEQPRGWGETRTIDGRTVYVSAVGIADDHDLVAVLVHDLQFVARRETKARLTLIAVLATLAVVLLLFVLAAMRTAWREWLREMRHALRGEQIQHRAFLPLARDMRRLVEQLRQERSETIQAGHWTPARLKQALSTQLQGEQIAIVANREPYIHQRAEDGSIRVLRPASGLVTALEPVMRACSGVWVAHGAGDADRDTVDAHDRVHVPPGEESYVVRRVWLSDAEEQGYYYGFANEVLWPLCHLAHTRPMFRKEDWAHYRQVNQKFADAVCDELKIDDPIVLVQDYHFALVPAMIRARLPRATILTFWHIPWSNAERFGICPWREEILEGLLGSSILGFQTQLHCNNFIDAVDSFIESRIDREEHSVTHRSHRTLIRPYPISIEWPPRWVSSQPAHVIRAAVFRELGLSDDALLGIGVDRLDYTKGIEERLLAVERLLELQPEFRGRFSFVQLAAPSRTRIDTYRNLNDSVEATVTRINERFGHGTYRPVHLLRAHHEPARVYDFYRAANVCYVSSLHDGMNLVAKEFVAAREDERGVLVLSQFTGAARELTEALVVNPYDIDQAADALATALQMRPEEQIARMRMMRRYVAEFNVYRWAGRMITDASELRRRERISGLFPNAPQPLATLRSLPVRS